MEQPSALREAAYEEAVPRAERLVDRIHRRLPARLRAQVQVDDLLQEARLALWAVSARWEAERGSLWAFAFQRVHGALMDSIRATCPVQVLPIEAIEEVAAEERDLAAALDAQQAVQVQPLRQAAADLGYGTSEGSLTVQQVAQQRGISEQAVLMKLLSGAIRGVKRGRVWRVPAWAVG